MAEQKQIQFNAKHREEYLKGNGGDSSGKLEFFYIAIIASLVAHIFIMYISHMLTQDHTLPGKPIPKLLEMEVIEPELIQQLPKQPAEALNRTGELRNVTANLNSERTDRVVDYRGMSQEQINKMVYDDLKAMEAREFESLKDGHPDFGAGQMENNQSTEQKRSSENDWFNEKQQKLSYSGNVTASYDMSGRDALYNPVPTYRCKVQGTVVVDVVINQLGEVVDAKVNEAKSSINECLRNESFIYAKKWKFSYKADAAKRQPGPITFTFSAQ